MEYCLCSGVKGSAIIHFSGPINCYSVAEVWLRWHHHPGQKLIHPYCHYSSFPATAEGDEMGSQISHASFLNKAISNSSQRMDDITKYVWPSSQTSISFWICGVLNGELNNIKYGMDLTFLLFVGLVFKMQSHTVAIGYWVINNLTSTTCRCLERGLKCLAYNRGEQIDHFLCTTRMFKSLFAKIYWAWY